MHNNFRSILLLLSIWSGMQYSCLLEISQPMTSYLLFSTNLNDMVHTTYIYRGKNQVTTNTAKFNKLE